MLANYYFSIGAVFAAAAVVFGAFGAHALKASLTASQISSYETAVLYHLVHSLAICVLALWVRVSDIQLQLQDPLSINLLLFVTGIVFFSGCIYLLVLGGPRWMGPVTPLGGVLLILGWCFAAYNVVRS